MRTGLMKYGYERLYGPGSNLEKEWSAKFELLLMKLRQELLSAGSHNRPAGRLWAGFKSGFNFSNTMEDENNE
jgi:hypothetical protein